MFLVISLTILGSVGTHIFFFLEYNIILCILKGISHFKMLNFIFFSRKIEKKNLDVISKFSKGRVTLNTGIFFTIWVK